MKKIDRRDFFKTALSLAGLSIMMPALSACESKYEDTGTTLPMEKPRNWNPIEFNRKRGNSGAIPDSYLKDINGPEGEKKHIGKHLPYIPEIAKNMVIPEGYLPIMWGDPSKGRTPHPNAIPGPDNNFIGHWYNRIEIRRAVSVNAQTQISTYYGWPDAKDESSGLYVSASGGPITEANGTHTIYLAKLPSDVSKGDTVRVLAHCLTHGEYVDFIKI